MHACVRARCTHTCIHTCIHKSLQTLERNVASVSTLFTNYILSFSRLSLSLCIGPAAGTFGGLWDQKAADKHLKSAGVAIKYGYSPGAHR